MNKIVLGGLAAVGLTFVAAPASASTASIIDDRCPSVFEAAGGCVYSGNDDNVPLVEQLYNDTGKPGSPIELNLIGKINSPGTSGPFGSITYDPGNKTGTWSLPGYVVDFISVKGGNEFILIKLTNPGSSGTWSTTGLLVGGDNTPELSHIQFYGKEGAVVPEPGTWAMLIAGFGLVGAAARRRKQGSAVSA